MVRKHLPNRIETNELMNGRKITALKYKIELH